MQSQSLGTPLRSTRKSVTLPPQNAAQTPAATPPVQGDPGQPPQVQPDSTNLASGFIGSPVTMGANNPFVDANGNFALPGAMPAPEAPGGQAPSANNPFAQGAVTVQQQPFNPFDNPFFNLHTVLPTPSGPVNAPSEAGSHQNPLFPADDGATPGNVPHAGAGNGQTTVNTNPFTNGMADRLEHQNGAKNHGTGPTNLFDPAPQVRSETDKAKQAEAKRQAEEALDNLTFFKGMQTRLAALCKQHGLDADDMAPLSNLFKDAAVTSMNQLAQATEAATGRKLQVDDPLFVNAMKLARAADPLEGDGSKEEGSEGTFELKSGSAPAPASGKALDHSIGLLPKEAQPGVKQAALKAGDVLASTSQEHASVIDLGALPKKSMLDLDDADHALSDLSEDDGVGSAAPAPKMKPVGKDKSLNLGVDPDVALEELEDLVAASSEESSPVFKDMKPPKASDIFPGKRVRP